MAAAVVQHVLLDDVAFACGLAAVAVGGSSVSAAGAGETRD